MWWEYLVVGAVGYFVGAIPSGLLVGRWRKRVDVRQYGSGKSGFTNVLRIIGPGASVLVLVADIAKGAVPVILARAISDSSYVQAFGGLLAVVGHNWPVYVNFRGGRGVATSYGAGLAMAPIVALILLIASGLVIALTRYMSLMSMISAVVGAAALVILALLGVEPFAYLVYGILAAVLIIFQHRDNIQRLLAGKEPKIGQRVEVSGQEP